jgi:hypothetical protein
MARHLTRQLPQAVHVGGVHALVKVGFDVGQGLTSHGVTSALKSERSSST